MDSFLQAMLDFLDPAALSYGEWVTVGMGLKESGCTAADWEEWSRRDPARYHPGECERKWETFQGSEAPVTTGSIYKLAADRGFKPPKGEGRPLGWDDTLIPGPEKPAGEPPAQQLIRYLSALFDPEDKVGYVTESYEANGRLVPGKGAYDRTAGELIEGLKNCGGDVGRVFGDWNESAGAWIRFNPLDGQGVKNDNVTDYRYALVEADGGEIAAQREIIERMGLPVAAMVFSGKKSVHAVVRVGASDLKEYRARVDYLYDACRDCGLEVDTANRNPSRLSRMPGVTRNGVEQTLLAVNTGAPDFESWKREYEADHDNLPALEPLAGIWDNLPPLSPPLIEGVLRQGHKMLIAGPSKAGKSFSLIELTIAIAEGWDWLGWKCARGRVLYINLELDRASCLHRFKDVYDALGVPPGHMENIDVWNLRGKSVPMDKLAPKLIRRAKNRGYIAIIIDPIYKIITGDENSADQMAAFCNQFDLVCTELSCAVIYCHHHSKGAQGQKRSMDRASGSGVFARDPDAMLDLIQLELTEPLRTERENRAVCDVAREYLSRWNRLDGLSDEDFYASGKLLGICKQRLPEAAQARMREDIAAAKVLAAARTAWRIEGTLREFPRFKPKNVWFDYPVHRVDTTGVLGDLGADEDYTAKGSPWKKNFSNRRSNEERRKERKGSIETAFEACQTDGKASLKELAEYAGTTEKTVRSRLKEHGGFRIEDGKAVRTDE